MIRLARWEDDGRSTGAWLIRAVPGLSLWGGEPGAGRRWSYYITYGKSGRGNCRESAVRAWGEDFSVHPARDLLTLYPQLSELYPTRAAALLVLEGVLAGEPEPALAQCLAR